MQIFIWQTSLEYKALWNTRLQPRFSIFMWRVLHQRLAVGAEFLKLGIFKYPFCAHCEEEIETIDNMFIHCEPASIIWSWVKVSFDVSLPLFSLADLWKFVIQVKMRTEKKFVGCNCSACLVLSLES